MNVSCVNLVFIVRMRSCLSRWFARQVTIVTLVPYNLWVAIAGLFVLKVWDPRIRIMLSTNPTSYKLETVHGSLLKDFGLNSNVSLEHLTTSFINPHASLVLRGTIVQAKEQLIR